MTSRPRSSRWPSPALPRRLDVTVGGHPGMKVELSTPADLDVDHRAIPMAVAVIRSSVGSSVDRGSAAQPYTHGIGQHETIYIVDVDGTRQVIDAMYLPGASAADRAEQDQIVASISVRNTRIESIAVTLTAGRRRAPPTTSARSTARRRRAAPAALAGGRLDVGRPVLAGQDEDAAQPGSLGGPDVGPDVVADHRDLGRARGRDPPRGAGRATASEKNAGDGLPMIVARVSGRELEPGDERAGVERRARPASATTGCDACPTSVAPPLTSRNARLRLSNVASSGESPMTTAAAGRPSPPASSWVSRCWPANSVRASSDASTYSGWPGKRPRRPRRRRRQRRLEALRRDRRPELRRPARQRRAADGRGVGHDPVRHPAPFERRDRPRSRRGSGLPGDDDHPVEVEQQGADAAQGRRAGRSGWAG